MPIIIFFTEGESYMLVDDIHANKVTFPDAQDKQEVYAETIAHTVRKLSEYPLSWIKTFNDAIQNQVGYERLSTGKRLERKLATRYYLWTCDHPKWELCVRVLTLGISILVARRGKEIYDSMRPIISVAKSINTLQTAIYRREERMRTLTSKIQQGVQYDDQRPERWAHLLEEHMWNDKSQYSYFYTSLKGGLSYGKNTRHNNPELYQTEARFKALRQVYELLECSNWQDEIQADKLVYEQNANWASHKPEEQMKLLERMTNAQIRFWPLIQERARGYIHALSWDVFSKLNQHARQAAVNQTLFIIDQIGFQELRQSMASLQEHVRSKMLKNCSWQQDEANFLREICHDLYLENEYLLAQSTYTIEKTWDQTSPVARIENTKAIAQDAKHYEKELEARRQKVFSLAKTIDSQPFEMWEYVVGMLEALQPVYEQGCMVAYRRIKEQLLRTMQDKKVREDEEQIQDCLKKAALLKINQRIVNEIQLAQDQTVWGSVIALTKVLWTGKSCETRLVETLEGSLLDERTALRKGGEATEIARLPQEEDFAKLTLTDAHYKVEPPSVPAFNGKCNIKELLTFVKEADSRKLIPAQLPEILTNGTTKYHTKANVIDALSKMLDIAINAKPANKRLTAVHHILKHYTTQVAKRLKEAQTKEVSNEIYKEIVELVLLGMGFAYFNCEDRKYNAAMIIFNEKVSQLGVEDASISQQVLMWAAKKRSELLMQVLQEMIANSHYYWGQGIDVASTVGYWRHQVKGDLGLGDVPESAYYMPGGLDRSSIIKRFKQAYTAEWVLEQAWNEFANKEGINALKFPAMDELFTSRISNYDEIKYNLLDEETYKPLPACMVLFLQEVGLFNPIV